MASNFLTVITIALILDYMRLFNEILSKLARIFNFNVNEIKFDRKVITQTSFNYQVYVVGQYM